MEGLGATSENGKFWQGGLLYSIAVAGERTSSRPRLPQWYVLHVWFGSNTIAPPGP